MTRLYSLYTPSHRVLKERFFEPTLPADLELRLRYLDQEGAGMIQDPSWRRAIQIKVDVILQAIEENWGEVFAYSDVDVQFFGSFAEWIPRALARHDLAFQIDAPGPYLCAGFFFCRANDSTLAVWRQVRDRVQATEAREDDQAVLRHLVRRTPELRWHCLPPVFCGGGTLTGRHWTPGGELPVPEGILVHHANFTCGVHHKTRQCEQVREQVAAASFVPLAEAYETVLGFNGAPRGRGGAGPNHSKSSPDHDPLLHAMAQEPEFHPYATEAETAQFLAALVRLLKASSVLELGTHKGFTTVHLARALAECPGARLVTVDRCDQRSPQLRALGDAYTFIQGHDLEIIPTLPGEFDLVYIDTTHRYEHTVAELEAVRAHSPRAVLVLHDVLACPGVAQALHQVAAHYESIVLPTPPHPTLGGVNGLAVLRPRGRPA